MVKLTIKEGSNPNYLASIQKIESVEPIEGADRLVKTVISGYDMVISKDMVPGTTVVYFPVECAISEKYLSANNLYESSEFFRNANHESVIPFAEAAEKAKLECDKEEFDKNWAEVKANCGFFGKTGRVRILKLRGQYSQGFIARVDTLVTAFPELKGFNFEAHIGEQFNCVGENEICWKYIPPKKEIPEHLSGNQKMWKKRMKHLKRFNRLIDGQFEFHYSTQMLAEHISEIKPDDVVSISVKVHGTSAIFANVLTKRKLNTWEKVKKFFGIKVKEIEYGNIYSSRSVIKNQYINPNAQSFYSSDIWGCVNKVFFPYIKEGMTVYGEIAGYLEGTQQMIQKNHDYGCKPGQWKFMPYRITETDELGNKKEWNLDEVDAWTHALVSEHPELEDKVLFLNILYHGKMRDLYPELDIENHWHQNLLAKLKVDTEHFGMELNEPMCKNKVPREGIVIRIDNDKFARAWKLKTAAHYSRECKQHDDGEVDMEEAN